MHPQISQITQIGKEEERIISSLICEIYVICGRFYFSSLCTPCLRGENETIRHNDADGDT